MTAHGDDIDGLKIAFEMLLGRLLEEAREAHMMREKLGDKDGAVRDGERRIAHLEETLNVTRAALTKREAGDRKLGNLHNEALMARNSLENLLDKIPAQHVPTVSAQIERLEKAAKEAEEFCDPVPF